MISRIGRSIIRGNVLSRSQLFSKQCFHANQYSYFWDSVGNEDGEEESLLEARGLDIPEEFPTEIPDFVHIIPVLTPPPYFRGGSVTYGDHPVDKEMMELLRKAYKGNEYIGLFYTELDLREEVERVSDVAGVGMCGYIEDISRVFGDSFQVSIIPIHPIEIIDQPFVSLRDKVEIEPYPCFLENESDLELLRAYGTELLELLEEVFDSFDFFQLQSVIQEILEDVDDSKVLYYEKLIDYTIQNVISPSGQSKLQQQILEENNILEKTSLVVVAANEEVEKVKLGRQIKEDLEEKFHEQHRRGYLQEQYQYIGNELGYTVNENKMLREKFLSMLEEKYPPEDVMEVIEDELRKLDFLDPHSSEFNVCRTYLEWLCSTPWGVVRQENFDLGTAEEALDERHYGLQDLKERILEFIAVQILKNRKKEELEKESGGDWVEKDLDELLEGIEDFANDINDFLEGLDDEGSMEDLINEIFEQEVEDDDDEVGQEQEDQEKQEHEEEEEMKEEDGKSTFKKKIIKDDKSGQYDSHGKILCFVGPPGTGKTSIGEAIATALGRTFFRFSVGGMDDVSEVKGHRRTYVGAMPGKLVQVLKRAQCTNPVILIDEIDKMGSQGFRGDPASALLEVLDPEQNHNFLDHYLDVPLDLSKVLFICTANLAETIPRALFDRMEVLRLSGYVTEEKVEIAKRHLIPRLQIASGCEDLDITFSDEVLRGLVIGYCREAGVRSLEKELEKVFRKMALLFIREGRETFRLEEKEELFEYLGKPRFSGADSFYGDDLPIGTTTGLAWTALGGSILYIETVSEDLVVSEEEEQEETMIIQDDDFEEGRKGGGKMKVLGDIRMTGMLQEVMKESVNVAYTYSKIFFIRARRSTRRREGFFRWKTDSLTYPRRSSSKRRSECGYHDCDITHLTCFGTAREPFDRDDRRDYVTRKSVTDRWSQREGNCREKIWVGEDCSTDGKSSGFG